MTCISSITKEITNCDFLPRAGYEEYAWLMNWEDVTFTFGDPRNLITDIEIASGETAYSIRKIKKEMNAGFDLVTEDMGDYFTHYFSIKPYEQDSAAIMNLDRMKGLVLIVELKGEKTEGCFVVFGVESGLYRTGSRQRRNDNYGLPLYEFGTGPGLGERYSRYIIWDTDYTTTKALIDGLIVEPALVGMDDSELIGMDGSDLIGMT